MESGQGFILPQRNDPMTNFFHFRSPEAKSAKAPPLTSGKKTTFSISLHPPPDAILASSVGSPLKSIAPNTQSAFSIQPKQFLSREGSPMTQAYLQAMIGKQPLYGSPLRSKETMRTTWHLR